MNKELKALEVISNVDTPFVDMVTKEVFISNIKIKDAYDEEYDIVKKGLEVLEIIKSTPSMALALYNACDTDKYSTHKEKREKVKEWLEK